jgi:hypothetical protein
MRVLSHRDPRLTRRDAARLALAGGASLALGTAHLRRALPAVSQEASPTPGAQVIVGDVLDFTLGPEGRWEGHFGSVTMTMHAAFFDDGDVWYIRTDASDQAFAEANGLVHVPLLANALKAEGSYGKIYLFEGGRDDQCAVVNTVPGQTTFTPAFQLHFVTFSGEQAELLTSEAAVLEAAEAGTATVEATECIVNYPLVLWPEGGLPVDPDLVNPLGPGVLIEEPDTDAGEVTFKLHQCYPGSRYIATDTSAAPMAPMMGVSAAEATQALIEVGATAPIYVFMPGLPGPAAMGGQPSVFNSTAGDPIWSPFWEHMTVAWNDGFEPAVLTSEAEVRARQDAGEVTVFAGVPETDPMSFVVNCPAPVLAENDYDPADFAAMATPS